MFAPRPPLGYPSQVSSPAVIDVHPARVPVSFICQYGACGMFSSLRKSFQLDQRPRLGSSAEHTEVLELHPVRPNKVSSALAVLHSYVYITEF